MNVLEQALEEGQRRGWCGETFEDEEGHLCALGALRVAYGADPFTAMTIDRQVWQELQDALLLQAIASVEAGELPDGYPLRVGRWRLTECNDLLVRHGLTHRVEEAFRVAAKRYDEALGGAA